MFVDYDERIILNAADLLSVLGDACFMLLTSTHQGALQGELSSDIL